MEIGCRIEGSLFSPGSKNNSHSVKKQLRITKNLKGKVHNSGGSLEVKQVERHRQAWAGYHNAGGGDMWGPNPKQNITIPMSKQVFERIQARAVRSKCKYLKGTVSRDFRTI